MPAPYCYEHPRPQVTVDLVVFRFEPPSLRVVLIRRRRDPFAGKWAIPGGFLEMDEPVEAAARRELREETGLEIPGAVEPIGFFGAPGRDPRGRTITLAHAAVVPPGSYAIQGGDDAAEAAWVELSPALELAFDHAQILASAQDWLMRELIVGSSALELLPAQFSAADIEALLKAAGQPPDHAQPCLRLWMASGIIVPVSGESDSPDETFQRVDGDGRPG